MNSANFLKYIKYRLETANVVLKDCKPQSETYYEYRGIVRELEHIIAAMEGGFEE